MCRCTRSSAVCVEVKDVTVFLVKEFMSFLWCLYVVIVGKTYTKCNVKGNVFIRDVFYTKQHIEKKRDKPMGLLLQIMVCCKFRTHCNIFLYCFFTYFSRKNLLVILSFLKEQPLYSIFHPYKQKLGCNADK